MKWHSLKCLTAALSFLILVLIPLIGPSQWALAQINCQSEIYLPTKPEPEARFKKGYCLIKLGKFQEGVSTLSGVDAQLPLVADYVLYYQGAGYQNLSDFANASAAFNKILTQYPGSGVKKKTLARLGNIYTDTGDYANAERIFQSLYGEESDRHKKASYLFSLGSALQKQGKYRDASAVYKRVWLEFPETKASSDAYKAAKSLSQTQGIAFRATESDYAQRGNKLFSRSRWSAALNNYDLVPSKTTAIRTKMAIAMVNTKQLNKAENILKGINSPESLFWRGKLKSKQGLDSQASDLYYQIHVQYPSSPLAAEGLYNAARLYQINGNIRQGGKNLRRAYTVIPQEHVRRRRGLVSGMDLLQERDVQRGARHVLRFYGLKLYV